MFGSASSVLRRHCASTSILRNGTQSLLKRPIPTIISRAPVSVDARRSLHSVPDLTHLEDFKQNGIEPLFTPEGFNAAWTDYQGTLVDKLNQLVAGTTLENESAFDTAISTSRRPELASIFNYASQAHNNHFFFDTLHAQSALHVPEAFLAAVQNSFGSFETFRTEFLGTALAIFGSGWVWLVVDQTRNLRILATYNAGSPYPGAHARRQDYDSNNLYTNVNHPIDMAHGNANILDGTGWAAGRARMQYPIPLLNVSVWPQTWMTDYGVKGKEQYLNAWWECVNWAAVTGRMPDPKAARTQNLFGMRL